MKIKVPYDLSDKIWRRVCELHQGSISAHIFTITVQAFAETLSANPMVPTEEQAFAIKTAKERFEFDPWEWVRWGAVEWQRRMFLAPEPEIPEEIKDLLWLGLNSEYGRPDREMKLHDIQVLEAYRRGKESK